MTRAYDNAVDARYPSGRRNLIINGAMQVAQRGTTGTPANSGYVLDRFNNGYSGLDGTLTTSQETSVVPEGFTTALKMSMSASESSLDAADYIVVRQVIEAQNLQHLKYGTSNAVELTASFWVRSSVASTYTAELYQQDSNLTIGKTFTIDTADTWEYKTLTFAANTTGTITNDSGNGLQLSIWLDAGSNFTSGTFSTAWQTNDNTERVYDTTGWLESTSPTFYITGVQLEVGNVATPFEHRSYGEELALCQRYYTRLDGGDLDIGFVGYANSASTFQFVWHFPTTLRSAPTDFDYTDSDTSGTLDNWEIRQGGVRPVSTTVTIPGSSTNCMYVQWTTVGNVLSGSAAGVFRSSASNTFIAVDVEL